MDNLLTHRFRVRMGEDNAGTGTGLRRWLRHRRILFLLWLASFLANAAQAPYSAKDEPKPLVTAEDFTIESQRKEPIAVRRMVIDAELVPSTHQLKAKARIEFQALENTSTASFELNNNLYPTNVTADDGRPLSARRS